MEDNELIRKVYQKQKDDPLIGDWVKRMEKYYAFIGLNWNDDVLRNTPKEDFIK